MKAVLIALLMLGAEAGPAELDIVGPPSAEVGELVELEVLGVPELDLDQPLGKQLGFMDEVEVFVSAPQGVAVEIEKDIDITWAPTKWELMLLFTPEEVGAYVIIVDWNKDPYGLSYHRVEVLGEAPTPVDPGPEVPEEKEAAKVTYIYEKDKSTPPPDVSKLLMDLNDQDIEATEIDQDVVDGTGEVPDQYKKSIAAIQGKELPCVVIEYTTGEVVVLITPSVDDIEEALN